MSIEVGDIVKCVDFTGGSGGALGEHGVDAFYQVIEKYCDGNGGWFLRVKHDERLHRAYERRFVRIEPPPSPVMEPEVSLEEILQFEELLERKNGV